MTLRDEAWNAALEYIIRRGKFKISDLPFDKREQATVRRALVEMEAYGWLFREVSRGRIWRAGPKAELCLNMTEEKIKTAHQ